MIINCKAYLRQTTSYRFSVADDAGLTSGETINYEKYSSSLLFGKDMKVFDRVVLIVLRLFASLPSLIIDEKWTTEIT